MKDDTPYLEAGQRFGRWALLESAPFGRTDVLCRCDCGTERRVYASNLRLGNSKSCGCLKRIQAADRVPYLAAGERFDCWTSLEPGLNAHQRVLCRCACGAERKVEAHALRRGKSRYCNRSKHMSPSFQYLEAGERFGQWVTLESARLGTDHVPCRCDCGKERHVMGTRLKNGNSLACGSPVHRKDHRSPYLAAGERFTRLVTLEDASDSKFHVLCRCDCGMEKRLRAASLRRQKSCGCLRRERLRENSKRMNTKHGLSRHPQYATWCSILRRTTNPRDPAYASYGGRGIQMHEPWRTNVEAFITWMDETLGPRPPLMSLDRIDNDGDYAPGNLRWATRTTQARNRRTVKKLMQERDDLLKLAVILLATHSAR